MDKFAYAHDVQTVICEREATYDNLLSPASPPLRDTSVRYVCKVCGTVWFDVASMGLGAMVAKEGDREKCRIKTEVKPAEEPADDHPP